MKYLVKTYEEKIIAGLDRLLGFPREKKRFLKAHGYPLNLDNPQSFNEKICHKKVYDRNPLLPIISDKFQVRDYVKRTLGEDQANAILIPLLDVSDSVDGIDYSNLPEEFVIKSNHGSGNNIIINKGDKFNVESFKKEAKKWFSEPYGIRSHEWAYDQIPRKILVETLLKDKSGSIPPDFKFSMIGGECAFVHRVSDRFGDFKISLFDKHWQHLDVSWRQQIGEKVEKPEMFSEMLEIARKLSRPFDYVRVDFYNIDGQIYFGELTNYPIRGRGKFTPTEFDFEMGKLWTLPNA